jgi:uncharacterized membrane protein (UPF0127 family)
MYKIFLVIILLVAAGYYLVPKYFPLLFSQPVGEREYATVRIAGENFKLEIADTREKRVKGLSGRNELASNEGMIFIFDEVGSHGITMRGMRFPLDIIWLRNNKVVEITDNVYPDTGFEPKVYYSDLQVDAVIELNAGAAGKLGLKVNDHLSW